MERYDVVIAGGGAIGSSVAYHLSALEGFSGSVAVLERDPSYRRASSALSVSGIRQQFSTPANIALSRWSIAFLRRAGELLEVDGERPDVGLTEGGYLFLASSAGADILRQNHRVQRIAGADVALLSRDELAVRYPWLNVGDVACGSLGLSGEGWFDGWSLLQALRRRALANGVRYAVAEITGIDVADNRVTAVTTATGSRFACGTLVNAAGPLAGDLAALAGLDLPVRPRKRIVHVIDCRTPLAACPMVIDPGGVYFRPEGTRYLAGVSPAPADDADCYDLDVDWSLFAARVWPALANRVPAFEAIRLVDAWAGHYEYNTVDQNAVLGPHPQIANFFFANGFSGHGMQQTPAVGRVTAEWIVDGKPRSVDVSCFGYERFATGRLVREINVI